MMDDIPNLDFNLLDDELLSYPFIDELGLIESKDIENILNEIENPKQISTYKNNYGFSKPTIVIKNSKKTKNKIGTSLLAKPPKKLKKDKNSLLKNSSFNINTNNSNKLQDVVFQKHFTSYFYEDHNYCFNPYIQVEDKLDINNNDYEFNSSFKDQFDEQVYKKNNKNLINSLFNLTNINLFNNDTEVVHDVDEYFNQSFSNSIESESINSNVGSENEEEFFNNIIGESSSQESFSDSNSFDKTVIELEENNETTLINTEMKNSELNDQQIEFENNEEIDLKIENENLEQNDLSENEVNGFIDDINNYITDTDNELISLDEEDDDIIIETDILIGEMFGDFGEYDLISSKKAKTAKANHKSKSSRNNKSPKSTSNTNRRSRTISNSYSVRSSSSCSCCSEDLSEEEQQNKKKNEGAKKQVKAVNKSNRRSPSKLIKTDNTYIRKKNRFILKNSSF